MTCRPHRDHPFFAVLSDTHGSVGAWTKARPLWSGAEAILHCGDVLYHGPRNPLPSAHDPASLASLLLQESLPLFLVRGNCDADVDALVLQRPLCSRVAFWWRGRTILAAHGEDFTTFREEALRMGAHLALSGHTHVASLVREGSTWFLNPGSLSLPKGKDPASFALVSEAGMEIRTLDGEILSQGGWD